MATRTFYTQCNAFLAISALHVPSCTHVQLASGSTNLFSAHVQLTSSLKNFFRRRVQLTSDLINLSSNFRVTHVQIYFLMICLCVTLEWHEKFVQKIACHTCVNVKFKLSCNVVAMYITVI